MIHELAHEKIENQFIVSRLPYRRLGERNPLTGLRRLLLSRSEPHCWRGAMKSERVPTQSSPSLRVHALQADVAPCACSRCPFRVRSRLAQAPLSHLLITAGGVLAFCSAPRVPRQMSPLPRLRGTRLYSDSYSHRCHLFRLRGTRLAAACTNARKGGDGARGRLLNSGWPCSPK